MKKQSPPPQHGQKAPTPRGLIGTLFHWTLMVPVALIGAVVFSIIVEWVLMYLYWPEQGSEHARLMLSVEVQYLNKNFQDTVFGSSPIEFAAKFVNAVDRYVFLPLGIAEYKAVHDMQKSVMWDYMMSAYFMTKLVMVRFCILALSLPAYVLFGVVGLITGLTNRDLRRFNVGRESTDRYELARKLVPPSVIWCFFAYLSYWDTLNPAYVIVPFAALFGYALHLTASNYKKYF